ncbi:MULTISPECIES: hypothetical protein [unclassified Bacillus (in: firmicutes)]|uniref:hypothetical protein n=1 Tax=unclassified Bacillus (in: firmicutes) TaxID=185979 RepID=UPI000D033476|nr:MULTISPECIES: hypothetical protein [unclassified Bacillus (in: firmicutes)]PRS82621.1 hypothetical protein C6346_00225 [Bacillus sp. CJCL2]PRS87369.1 hypothetical protein C6348_00225 [Bacillus sp. YBWC18]
MATIIVALVAAVLVIIGLVAFNVRHASVEKKEIKEDVPNQPDVPHSESEVAARPVEPEEEEEEASKPSQTDERVSGDDFYRQALQKFKQPEPPVKEEEPETKMNDDMYRSALQKLKQKDK